MIALQWSQSAKLFIKSKETMGYITGVKSEPNSNDPRYELWDELFYGHVLATILHAAED